MTVKKQGFWPVCLGLCLAALLALPAWAESSLGQANITPATTMKEIRANPSIQGSGLYTYVHTWERDCEKLQHNHDDETLEEVVGSASAPSCAAGLNCLVENYNAGIRVTYKLYTPEEIAAKPSRDHAEMYYFPAEQPGAKYAVVLSGNALVYSGELRGGVSTAWELHEQGYAVFALRYRIGKEAGEDAPLDDLGRAIQFITAHAADFGVQTEGYALLGYSSGGQIAGVFGSAEKGWQKYGVPKPGALLLAYPINDFTIAKPIYCALMDVDDWMQEHYYDYALSNLIAPGYPPVFLWYGKSDRTLKLFGFEQQGPALQKALEADSIPYEEKVYEKAGHGIGIGLGTEAEGWLAEAGKFWRQVTS